MTLLPPKPKGLDEFESIVMASDAPAVVIIDRDLMRQLVHYLHALEDELRDGDFW